jgi:hypothetical protein
MTPEACPRVPARTPFPVDRPNASEGDSSMNTSQALRRYRRCRRTAVIMLSFVASTACLPVVHSQTGDGAFDTYEKITGGFRAFHGDTFPFSKWVCEGGVLHSIKGRRVDLITREEYEDFELELDWKVASGANSGILYGVSEAGTETFWSGPEMQINDDPNHPDGLQAITSAGALYDLIPPNDLKRLKPTGEYNHVRIVSHGGHVEHWLNGAKILEYDWDSSAIRDAIGRTKFATAPLFMKHRKGHIALQSEGDEVWFRNIRIRRLPAGAMGPKPTSPNSYP